MDRPPRIGPKAWKDVMQDIESAFGITLEREFREGRVDMERLVQRLAAVEDVAKAGKLVIGMSLRVSLAQIAGIDARDIHPDSRLATLMPAPVRKERMRQLQQETEWTLPKLGMPIWAQHLYGLVLMVAFVLQFFYPLVGIPLFLGGIVLLYRIERWAWAFQYPTWGQWIDRTVVLNWPALQVGAVQATALRIAVADLVERHAPGALDATAEAFPVLEVGRDWPADRPQWHLVNGDCLREQIAAMETTATLVTMRECLCVGPVEPHADFFGRRAAFIAQAYDAPEEKYRVWVQDELDRLGSLPADAELNLWFEADLFCQVNLWYLLHRLQAAGRIHGLFRVTPLPGAEWMGFAGHDADELMQAFEARRLLPAEEVARGANLWEAYQAGDLAALQALSSTENADWPGLGAAVQAHLDLQPDAHGRSRPQRVLQEILDEGHTEFEDIFREFQRRAPVYGYGDLQVRALLSEGGHAENRE